MNAGQHLGNTQEIIRNLEWIDVNFSSDSIKYFQVLNWLPDYISLTDLMGKLILIGFIDYVPLPLPFLGKPSFNFFSMNKLIGNFSKNTIIDSEKKIFHHFHFDSLNSLTAINNHWNWLENKVKICIELIDAESDYTIKQHMLFSALAESLHAVQDFYSHSNWIEFFHQNFNFLKKEDFPTWFDIFVLNNENFNLIREKCMLMISDETILYSGYFPIGKDKRVFPIYHNDKKNKPGLNKDRAERPYFDVVWYLAYKNGIQWLNHVKTKYLNQDHIQLLNNSLSANTIEKVNKIYPFIEKIAFKLREWNGLTPFKIITLEIPEAYFKNNFLFFTIKLTSSEKLVKYDRDFRKSYFKIIIKNENDIIFKNFKFGKKSGISKFKIDLKSSLKSNKNLNLRLRVEYGLLTKEKIVIKQY